jgi:isoleucyl-tRNA synthetase
MEFNFPATEKKVLDFWKKHKIFQKSLFRKKRNFVFYEGPPTANAKPGIHHVLARVFKDAICRYKTMRGYKVIRKAGWDTHGLPVELEVEKKLGIKSKKEIEKFGIKKFNQKCKKSVFDYEKEWRQLTERIGFWLDMDNPYITCDPKYIETVWWIIKQISKKGLLYQDYKVVPYCPRCGTSLSSHEVAQGYKRIKEPAIYVKFNLKSQNSKFKNNVYLLVWTTTPWTLPANVAIAAHPELTYVLAKKDKEFYILLESKKKILGEKVKIMKRFKGKTLEGFEYEPLFSQKEVDLDISTKNIYKVLLADFVSEEEGTGLVHIAPAFGEEDMMLIKMQNANLKSQTEKFPIILTVDEEGKFKENVKKWKGMFVKEADPLIIDYLKEKGKLLKVEEYEHDYPFCWRCKTPLLYYAKKSWFIKMTKVKKDLLKNNQTINWIPPHIRKGRFGEWLREVKDWAISRERYWGTPLSVWVCGKCNHQEVIGSRKDLLEQKFSTNEYYILRHGEADNITKKRYSSHPEEKPLGLTLKGKKQIQEVAEELKKIGIDLIFSSDLRRCKETAQIIAKELKKEVIYDKRLREIDQGLLNGKPTDEARRFWDPENKLNPFEFTLKRIRIPAPKGESFLQVRVRVLNFVKEIEKAYQNKKILIISHEAPLLMLETATKGLNDVETAKFRVKNKIQPGELRKIDWKVFPYNSQGELDFHRPYVDEIQFFCKRCGGVMERVKEVIDCWFDSGSMPFAQWHYPFENRVLIDKRKQFPADFICEGIDQTRGWFYTLLAISTLLNLGPSYKNVIVLGHVLDEKGQKMSKSKGNVVNPWEIIEKYSADALRWYFFTINRPEDPKLFSEKDIDKALKKFIITFFNCYYFWKTYTPKFRIRDRELQKTPKELLDQWILSRLNTTLLKVTQKLDNFDVVGAARSIEDFVINDLSLWYIRRSRSRFQKPKNKKELREASEILGFVLLQMTKATAPFIPFLSEKIYQALTGREAKSVHLKDWPGVQKKFINNRLEEEMRLIRDIVSLGLRLRSEAKIKVRQPLLKIQVKIKKKLKRELLNLIKEELNVKEVEIVEKIGKRKNLVVGKERKITIALDITLTEELKEEGVLREFIRLLQDTRKKANLKPRDKIEVFLMGKERLFHIFQKYQKEILSQTKTNKIYFVKTKPKGKFLVEKEGCLAGENFWFGIIRPKKGFVVK